MSLISMALILIGTLGMTQGMLSSVDTASSSWQQAEERMGNIRRTEINQVSISIQNGGTLLEVTLGNQGEVALRDFKRWDVVVQYYATDNNYYIKRVPYTNDTPGDDQWTVTGIFMDAQASTSELFEPGILNPDEEAVVQIKLSPGIKVGLTNLVSIATPNGVVTPVIFTG